ncbi:cupin domain-containing protein [Pandoraea sp. NPDC090278]|uniref:cupin domain-containing protein n=1 Tax=Pandoraea sp. NPDC090278 TaxID=3364391 RepID=UPI003839EF85
MRRYVLLAAVPAAFAAGFLSSHLMPTAVAQSAPPAALTPQIIDVGAMTDEQIGKLVPNVGTLRSRTLVATQNGTVAVQSGNVPRHTHQDADEIQYVISGSGTFWLGDQQREVHPGDLIVIPRDTVHAGSQNTSGEFKVLAIKLPPQAPNDIQWVK